MQEFMVLIGQILVIVCIQLVVEIFIDKEKRPIQVQMVNTACVIGCVYLVMQFIFTYMLTEIIDIVSLPF